MNKIENPEKIIDQDSYKDTPVNTTHPAFLINACISYEKNNSNVWIEVSIMSAGGIEQQQQQQHRFFYAKQGNCPTNLATTTFFKLHLLYTLLLNWNYF